MTATGVVLFEADVGRDQEHTARLTNHRVGPLASCPALM
jgi:hypothetical protein